MTMLNMFIIPCDNPEQSDILKLKKSLSDVAGHVSVLKHRDLNSLDKGTYPWYGYMFSNEWMDESLQYALPLFLEEEELDYLVLFKKVIEDRGGVTEPRAFQMPRIFRSHVELEGPGQLVPKNPQDLSFAKVLDGWILEPSRKIQ